MADSVPTSLPTQFVDDAKRERQDSWLRTIGSGLDTTLAAAQSKLDEVQTGVAETIAQSPFATAFKAGNDWTRQIPTLDDLTPDWVREGLAREQAAKNPPRTTAPGGLTSSDVTIEDGRAVPPYGTTGRQGTFSGPASSAEPLENVGTGDVAEPERFFGASRPLAEQVEREFGIPAAFTQAVAANETGYGQQRYQAGRWNYHGIQDSTGTGTPYRDWRPGPNGERIYYEARQAGYASPLDGFRAFGRFLHENPRYRPALERYRQTQDAEQFARDVHAAGYAEDPAWSDKVTSIMRGVPTSTGVGSVTAPAGSAPRGGAAAARPAAMPQASAAPDGIADKYDVAFGFNQPYTTPFNPSIPNHRGVDLVIRGAKNGGKGEPVPAFQPGKVFAVTSDPNGGNGVIVLRDDGQYDYYGHFEALENLKPGQRIERGTKLGTLGETGTEGFPHVHYEVRANPNGDPMDRLIDPTPSMRGDRLAAAAAGHYEGDGHSDAVGHDHGTQDMQRAPLDPNPEAEAERPVIDGGAVSRRFSPSAGPSPIVQEQQPTADMGVQSDVRMGPDETAGGLWGPAPSAPEWGGGRVAEPAQDDPFDVPAVQAFDPYGESEQAASPWATPGVDEPGRYESEPDARGRGIVRGGDDEEDAGPSAGDQSTHTFGAHDAPAAYEPGYGAPEPPAAPADLSVSSDVQQGAGAGDQQYGLPAPPAVQSTYTRAQAEPERDPWGRAGGSSLGPLQPVWDAAGNLLGYVAERVEHGPKPPKSEADRLLAESIRGAGRPVQNVVSAAGRTAEQAVGAPEGAALQAAQDASGVLGPESGLELAQQLTGVVPRAARRAGAAASRAVPTLADDALSTGTAVPDAARAAGVAEQVIESQQQHALAPPPGRAALPAPEAGGARPMGPDPFADADDAAPAVREFSSTQLDLPAPAAERVRAMSEKVRDADLAADGREDRPHVTVKYGLETGDVEDVREIVEAHGPITVTLGKTSIFPANKQEGGKPGGFDVVKIDVDSKELRALNAELAKLPNGDTHPNYRPHVTLAYVKPGKGAKYTGSSRLEGERVTIDRLTFSSKTGEDVEIPLLGRKPAGASSGLRQEPRPLPAPARGPAEPPAPPPSQALPSDTVYDVLRPDGSVALTFPTEEAALRAVRNAGTDASVRPREVVRSMRSGDEPLLADEFGRRWEDAPRSARGQGTNDLMDELAVGPSGERARPRDFNGPMAVDDAPRSNINLNSGAAGGLLGAVSGDEEMSDDERAARGVLGMALGMAAGGRGRGNVKRAAQSANPNIRNMARQMRGDYNARTGMRPLGERIVAALTDKNAIVGNVEREIIDRITAAGGTAPTTRLAERIRVNPNSIAAQRAREEIAPALEKAGEDADWLEQYLVHMHNLDVAKAKGAEAYAEAIKAKKTPAQAQRIADNVRQTRQFSGDMTEADTIQAIKDMAAEIGPSRFQNVAGAAADVWGSFRRSLDDKLTDGRITPQFHQELSQRYPHYVRTDIADYFERGPAGPTPGGKTLGVSDIGIKPISREGTGKDRVNPIMSAIDALYAHEQAGVRNAAGKDLVALRDADPTARGLFKEVAPDVKAHRASPTETVPPDYSLRGTEQKLTVWENGQPRQFVIPGEYAALLTPRHGALLGDSTGAQMVRSFFGLWKALITTHNPGFQYVVSPLRDAGDYAVGEATRSATRGGPLGAAQAMGSLPGVVADYVRALPAAFEGLGSGRFGREVADLRRGGSGFEGRPAQTDRGLREAYRDLQRTGGMAIRTPEDALIAARTVLTLGAEPIGSRLELVPRIAAARRAANRGADELGQVIASKDATIDFLRGGWLTQQLNVVTPFLNPTVQSAAQVARLAKKNPAAFAAAVGTGIGVPAMLADAWNRSDEQRARDLEDVPDYIKNGGIVWMLPPEAGLDGTGEMGERKPNYLWVPLGSFAFAARLAREGMGLADPLTGLTPVTKPAAEADDSFGGRAARAAQMGAEILSMFSPVKGDSAGAAVGSLVPPVASEAIETWVDRDLYRGNRIATDRRDENASRLAKGFTDVSNAVTGREDRPSQTDHWIRGVGGYAGTVASAASDVGRSRDQERPIQDIPVAGGLASRVIRDTGGQRMEDLSDDAVRVPESIRPILAEAGKRREDLKPVPNRYRGAKLTREEQEAWQEATNAYVIEELFAARDSSAWDDPAKREQAVSQALTRARNAAIKEALPDVNDTEIRDRIERERSRKAR